MQTLIGKPKCFVGWKAQLCTCRNEQRSLDRCHISGLGPKVQGLGLKSLESEYIGSFLEQDPFSGVTNRAEHSHTSRILKWESVIERTLPLEQWLHRLAMLGAS